MSLLFVFFKKKQYFCGQNSAFQQTTMNETNLYYDFIKHKMNEIGLWLDRDIHRFSPTACGQDYIFPDIMIFMTHQGTAHGRYDMQDITLHPNELAFVMPGHVLRPLDSSNDYVFSRLVISPQLIEEMRFHAFSHDVEKFHYQPICQLTSEQADRLSAFGKILAAIIGHSEIDLPLRRRMLISQLAVGYEFINYYRREQDRHWTGNRHTDIFNRFCELVVTHYRESRETQFYAEKMHLSPKYFSRVIRKATGSTSPAEWIEQYVITQAKRLIETNRARSVKEIAYMLGFTEPTSFYRYFHRATGLTAKQYRDQAQTV